MPISRYGEWYVMMWDYFNSNGQGNVFRMPSFLDPWNNWPLKMKICLYFKEEHLFMIHYSLTKKIGVLKVKLFPHFFYIYLITILFLLYKICNNSLQIQGNKINIIKIYATAFRLNASYFKDDLTEQKKGFFNRFF